MLRNHVGPHEGHERGEFPDSEKSYEDQGPLATTSMEHQAERAHGPSQHRDQSRATQEARSPLSGSPGLALEVKSLPPLDLGVKRR